MPNWKGSERRSTLPADWAVTTLRILKRDRYRCQHIRYDIERKCGRAAGQVDHIINHAQGGSDDDSNLQALCKFHHDQKSGREGGVASGIVRRAKRDAAKPLHPGLMPVDQVAKQHLVEDPPPF